MPQYHPQQTDSLVPQEKQQPLFRNRFGLSHLDRQQRNKQHRSQQRSAQGDDDRHPDPFEEEADFRLGTEENDRGKYYNGGQGGHHNRHADIPRPADGGCGWIEPLLPAHKNTLHDDNGAIHHHADRDHQPHHGDDVERPTDEIHHGDSHESGEGNCQGNHQRHPQTAQEKQQDQKSEQTTPETGLGDIGQGGPNNLSLVEENVPFKSDQFRTGAEFFNSLHYPFGNVDGIGQPLFHDTDRHPLAAVHTMMPPLLRLSVTDMGHILQAKRGIVDADSGDLLDILIEPQGPHLQAAVSFPGPAAGKLDVVILQLGDQVGDDDAVRGKSLHIQVNQDLFFVSAMDFNTRHTVELLESGPDKVLRKVIEALRLRWIIDRHPDNLFIVHTHMSQSDPSHIIG